MKKLKFGERLRTLRCSAGMTQTELGKLLGVGKTAVSNYENDLSYPDISKLIDIAAIFQTSMDYLLGITDDDSSAKTMREGDGAQYQTAAQIPVLDDISEGLPKYPISQAVDFITIAPLAKISDYFGLYVPDNSMDKQRLQKGDTALIHRQDSAEDGDIVLAMIKGEGPVIRKLERKQDRIRLTAQSSDKRYKNRFFHVDSNQIQILGKVLYVIIPIQTENGFS